MSCRYTIYLDLQRGVVSGMIVLVKDRPADWNPKGLCWMCLPDYAVEKRSANVLIRHLCILSI